ncbi:MAG: ATP-binding protein [Clostridium sp.]
MTESLNFILIIIQLVLFIHTISCCSEKNTIKKDLFLLTILFVVNFFSISVAGEISIFNILLHILTVALIYFCYSEDYKIRIINSSFFYIFNSIITIISMSISKLYMNIINYRVDTHFLIDIIYFILYIFSAIIYLYRIKSICKLYHDKKKSDEIIIYSFILEFVLAPLNGIYSSEDSFIVELIIIIEQIFIAVVGLYFYKLYMKTDSIFELNKELELKNLELKKIKDKNLNIVSYLRQLYAHNNKEEIGNLLKEIINGNENIVKEKIEHDASEDTLIGICARNIKKSGINIDLNDSYDISFCDMNHLDLYRIITNILNNAVRALEGRKDKKISIRTYKSGKNAVIEIENNGPMIKEEDMRNIFKQGFTTKDNNDSSHGYGLSIVKELIENRNGKIEVRSTELLTMFRIVLPIKQISKY